MRLQDVIDIEKGELISDGSFEALNFCTADVDYNFLTFMEKEKFIDKMNKHISCIICTPEFRNRMPDHIEGIFLSSNPKYDFYSIHNKLSTSSKKIPTIIDPTATISDRAVIAEHNVTIGKNVVIEANVVINENVFIMDNVIIHSNCIIGGRSFDFAKSKDGDMIGWIDAGKVIIRDHVEICSSVHIAQACLKDDITYLDENCKIDSFVHLGHGAHIGKRTLIAAGAIIGGNSIVGDDVWIGINATVSNRMHIEDNSRVSLGAVVTKSVKNGEIVTGNFAISHELFINNLKESLINSCN